MRQVYIKQITFLEPAAAEHYVYDAVIRPGKVLEVLNLSAYWSAIATTEEIHFFVEVGGRKVFIGEAKAIDTAGRPFLKCKVVVGEGARLGVYCPDSAAADLIYFDIYGIFHSLEEWHKEP